MTKFIKPKRTYEVLGYDSKEAFNQRDYITLEEYLTNKKYALKTVNKYLGSYFFARNYPIIKVQSSDREFIKIFQMGE